ncbi:tRNA (adenosine(37)-N6)-dimethylallyltransferase MiaA [Zavarzinia compransoris]|uniref:tRNA dimethylallyltransferase n=1 Tax=Zavarzinia compransoris TaxID=1264899 RepID=A0A317E6P2_9PROT|nr:tRNA (adenosine(37)-N6)-dimethylallyltransferase MiaA [Zavarzinia compransoris]PWR21896.1 tRNA (adenosine(37)-N6)-dimethylallyltransferase MiaA [Zavarzinia compransoris]TDP47375.1 tRNA dimethylallyltransferase [Zavarzinia compransoris]
MRATVLIAGPTASGKSGLALALARHFGGVVINADSMQVYGRLRILTARPDAAAEAAAPHRLYGVLAPDEVCSAARWASMARAEIAAAHEAGRLAVVVGGTGLYFHALTEGLSDLPAVDPAVRQGLAAELAALGAPALHARLAGIDPALAARLKPGDSQRILRGLEIHAGTGRPLSSWQAATAGDAPDIGLVARYVVAPPRPLLLQRIRLRLEQMAAEGAIEEARAVAALGLDALAPAAKAIGLRPFAAHAAGEIPLAAAIERAEIETRQYAKRQMTWARGRMADWDWLGGAQETERIIGEIERKIREPGLTTQS